MTQSNRAAQEAEGHWTVSFFDSANFKHSGNRGFPDPSKQTQMK